MTFFLIILTLNIAALTLIYFLLKRRIDRKSDPEVLLAGLAQEVEGLVTDLNSTTERNLILLEERVKKLKLLVAEADKRAVLLKKETQVNDKSRNTYEHLRRKASVSTEVPVSRDPVSDKREKTLSRPEQAVALYRSGHTLEDISRELDVPMGEVELMISLADEKSFSLERK